MTVKFSYITSGERLSRAQESLREEPYVFLDTEVSNDRIRLVQLGGKEDIFILDLFDLGEEGVLFLRELLSSKGIVGHNLKFDLKYLYSYGIEPQAVFDTMIASQLLGDTDKNSLKRLQCTTWGRFWKGPSGLQLGKPFLGKEELEYAALDVKVVRDLFLHIP